MPASHVSSSPGARLRTLLSGATPGFVMGAYDGVSARIAADAGFPALWASGLCMSTALGLRDSNEASWTEVLNLVSCMVEATGLPILVDGDTGHGNFNTARHFTARAERIGAAGVCLEDKVFPKTNSFVEDAHQLAPIPEFCGKIEACRVAVGDPEFMIVARTEALIAGAGLDEAVKRAEAYRDAGADAIFIHSKQPTISEIAGFAGEWGGRLPLIVSPTTYYATPMAEFARLGIGGVIWANQSMRAAVSAIQRTCQAIRDHGPAAVEPLIAPLEDVFTLMRYGELARDEARFGGGECR
jgi:phosphoenolpyruvate phosphomutase